MSEPQPPDLATDADLAGRMAAGDRDAFAALFRRYQGAVYRFCCHMTGSADTAEDLTQDVFIELARSGTRYVPALGSLRTYLYGIARHLVLKRDRRSSGRGQVDLDSLDPAGGEMMATSVDPVEALSRAEQMAALRRAIALLPPYYREVLVLCDLHGVSYEDAAGIVGCPVGTVRSRLNRARRLLRERCRLLLRSAGTDERRIRWPMFGRRPRVTSSES